MAGSEIDLLAINRGTITAPAGCGKTQLIANALGKHHEAKPVLVLTHTNAGVAALKARLDRAGAARSRYRISTLDGWAMRLISTFPQRSGHDSTILELANPRHDYPKIRNAAAGLLASDHIDDIVASSYSRLIVDEHQDCSVIQHAIVYNIAAVLPTCVLGDPMQAIFNFGAPVADWDALVCVDFPSAGELATPWRWKNAGEEEFGRWLLNIRALLRANQIIDLTKAPRNVTWYELDGSDDHGRRLKACLTKPPTKDGSVLIIADSTKPIVQKQFASQTPGAVAVENVDLTDLVAFTRDLNLSSPTLLSHVVEFAAKVMTGVGAADLLARVSSLQRRTARREASDVTP
jgi:DNA helicase-2/ATP-dependent DNA helicase PcrA